MAEAAYAAGPALLGAPRPLYFFRIFYFLFQRGAHANSVPVWGPQRAQISQNLKSEAPNGFFCSLFQCFSAGPKQSASAGPQRAQVHQNLLISGAPNVSPPYFQCFSAVPQRAQGPQKDVKDLKI
jgi:hypothetical protein